MHGGPSQDTTNRFYDGEEIAWYPTVWLSFYTTPKDLKRLFSPFGAITGARLVVDSRTQRPKGYGFVTFESDVDAQNALKAMNGKIIDGRLIFVEVAKPITPAQGDANTN